MKIIVKLIKNSIVSTSHKIMKLPYTDVVILQLKNFSLHAAAIM